MLQSGMAISVLFLYTSNQIGSTYGDFNTSKQQNTTIELCKVFPGQIEKLLQELSGHIKRINELTASLSSHSVTLTLAGSAGIESLSLEELDHAAQETSQQIAAATDEIGVLEGQLSFNAGVWLEIMQEVASTARILSQIGGYMVNFEPNCLEIRDAQFFEEFQNSLSQSSVLSESLVTTLNGILNYLVSIHEIGGSLPPESPVAALLEPNLPAFLTQEPILTFMARAYVPQAEVSTELRSAYEQMNTELNEAKRSLASEIDTLKGQQNQIAEAKAKLLEQARKEEEERQAQEKKQQEEAAEKAKEKAGKPDKDAPKPETPPAGDPDPDGKNNGTDEPVASASPVQAVTPEPAKPVDSLDGEPAPVTTPGETPSEQPSAEPAPAATTLPATSPIPAATPAPSASPEPDSIKGGD
ncbi:hypothetical protein A8L34_18640 [Bacillus sp. FJAT-27264]|uniref:hypothetical protein n=1 Tax=Paenibacillus sp. (strain DSM 101736 / FJAT-27264) TaxID=1850362 RepID=UPI000807D57D|nr:hypothetical protein [Bacillus sp. FJAT-27264]OBZ10606.1 hypothetical protein A8L34_18640 [Bacillus sp. FJAT-27264]